MEALAHAEADRRHLRVHLQAPFGRAGQLRRAAHEPAQRDAHPADRRGSARREDHLRRWPRPADRPGAGPVQGQRLQHPHYSRAGDNIDDKINGVNVDAVWSLDRFYIDSLKFGLSQTNRKKSRDLINNALNGGADHYSGENAINVGALGGNVINQTLSPSGFLDGVSGNFPRSFLGFDVDTYAQALKAWDGKPRPGRRRLQHGTRRLSGTR
jgi:hypothetical protein